MEANSVETTKFRFRLHEPYESALILESIAQRAPCLFLEKVNSIIDEVVELVRCYRAAAIRMSLVEMRDLLQMLLQLETDSLFHKCQLSFLI
jgi:hypothetical protein